MYDTNWSDEYLKSTGYKPNDSTTHDHLCRCPGCEGNDPPEDQQVMREAWQAEQGMRAFEDAMWGKWKRENAIEPVLPEQDWVWPCNLCGNLQDTNVNWEGIPANCERCFIYICNEHGGVDAEGNIWCENCAKEHNVVLEPDPIPDLGAI